MINFFGHPMKSLMHKSRLLVSVCLALSCCAFLSNPADGAEYPLEIIQPRIGLDVTNRFYKAYPGLEFDVAISVIGGRFPYEYRLVSGPVGMDIDASIGALSWSVPSDFSGVVDVQVSVTDSQGQATTVQWPITITTNGFIFIDAINGRTVAQGGDGSIDNPWREINDWYLDKYNDSYAGQFLYWRTGTYRTISAPRENDKRIAIAGGDKPLVWLAYPGDSPIIDTTGSHVSIYAGSSNVYFSGLEFRNFTKRHGVRISSSGSNVVFRKNKFFNLPAGAGGSGTNASALMISDSSQGSYWSIIDNEFDGIHDKGYAILGYSTQKTLIARNRITGIYVIGSKAIGPKTNNRNWFIRNNRIDIDAGDGVWIDTYPDTGDIEISYNLIMVDSGHTLRVGQEDEHYGPITSLRNTYIGARILLQNLANDRGPVLFKNDVIINQLSNTNGIDNLEDVSDGSRLIIDNVLTGTESDGIVDASGRLTGEYAQFLGTRGFELASTQRPKAPILQID